MPTRLCPIPLLNLHRRPDCPNHPVRGQVLVIFAVALLVLIFFIGLAIDAGSLYVTYGQLKRAVDSAVVAAANTFKRGETVTSMQAAAEETLVLHNVNMTEVDLRVFICDADGDSVRDASLAATVPVFYQRCPRTEDGESPRKLVWVEAKQRAPFYFLGLLGFGPMLLTTDATAEAAPIDLVLVIDTSESMVAETSGYIPDDYNPDTTCTPLTRTAPDPADPNPQPPLGACLPFWHAKYAAWSLLDKMYDGYDQVAIVTYDSRAVIHPIPNRRGIDPPPPLTDDLEAAKDFIWSDLKPRNDPPARRLWQKWIDNRAINPVNPEDLDGDGRDIDDPAILGYTCPPMTDPRMADRWWDYNPDSDPAKDIPGVPSDPFGWGGVPCDDDNLLDAYDLDASGSFTMADHHASLAYLAANDPSLLSTCIGCGLRAANVALENARPGAVWVVILLTDGIANLSDTFGAGSGPGDTPSTGAPVTLVPSAYPNGFCNGRLNQGWWRRLCIDRDFNPRSCIDADPAECPPGAVHQNHPQEYNYSVSDYARDMADALALTVSSNPEEPTGNDVAVYTILLGTEALASLGEPLLRYIAAVGDDGDRTTDPCESEPLTDWCGQYYYINQAAQLVEIFEDIATRIYTRITH